MSDDLERVEESLEQTGGPSLLARSWRPRAPRATLLLVHGYAEHGGRYERTASDLARRGFHTSTVDLRGHGRSGGQRGHVGSFDEYLDDVSRLHAHVRATSSDGATCLVGHSMGGLVALLYALRYPAELKAVALSSPLLALHPALDLPRPLAALARRLALLAPRLRVPRAVNPAHVSRSPEVVAEYASDPLVFRGTTLGWYAALHQALVRAWRLAPELSLPLWLAWAGDDRLVDARAHSQWADRTPAGRVRRVERPGQFHELFNEPERDETLAALDAWLHPHTCDGREG